MHNSKHIKSSLFGTTGKDKVNDSVNDKNVFGVILSFFLFLIPKLVIPPLTLVPVCAEDTLALSSIN